MAETTGLPAPVRERLAALTAEIAADPARIATAFPAAARRAGRGPGPSGDPAGIAGPTLDDLVRGELLAALAKAVPADRLAAETADLYRYGDSDEKRAVLRALPRLGLPDAAVAPLLADALRGNDPRLLAAALGTPAAAALDDAAWRHGVLKCLFTGVPVGALALVAERADAELARMVADHAVERIAAGRDVPADAWPLLAGHPAHRAAVERAAADRAAALAPAPGAARPAPDHPRKEA
ncbi:EboA domain-containing protein [Nocardiopsis trehalosi]|uniref:EboA domain-containing protein n=1 Tax=Nocardiopsis trehalosi TaxID=109329 RepID=UPI0009FF0B10|nr:EboA domain-containing protein [Nocardiopsis trehalosi]